MEKKKIKVYLSIAYIVLLFTYAGIDFYISIKKSDRLFEYLLVHYKTLRVNDSLNNKVISIYQYPKDLPITGIYAVQYVEVDNKNRYRIVVDDYITNVTLLDALKIGSRLIKRPGSDTLIVITNGRKYLFTLNKDAP